MLFVLAEQNTIANQFVAELRDARIQQDRMRFRKNLERLGAIMAYEISKRFTYVEKTIQTPNAVAKINVLGEQPVLITILRAGLPYYAGFQDYFDQSDAGFIGAYRQEGQNSLTIKLDYVATPSLEGKQVVLIDPMLATGKSIVDSVNALIKRGRPAHLYIAALVAAPEGVAHLTDHIKVPFSIWTCALDEKLNDAFYIVPGLGDAGDLCFGEKM